MIKKIALIGNPNVGKSTIFNTLTKKKEHTGNWSGKTVESAIGKYKYNSNEYEIYDLPGTYSLNTKSKEEEITKEFIKTNTYDLVVIVCDATCLERNLNLVFEIMKLTNNIILCINLIDEANKKGITINSLKLSKILNIPVVLCSARKNIGIENLLYEIENFKAKKINIKIDNINKLSNKIASDVINFKNTNYNDNNRKIDKILTNKYTGIPIMILCLLIIFWITIIGANYPSNLLHSLFNNISNKLVILFDKLGVNTYIKDVLINGIYKTTAWVVAVMLPPMAIFFPLFSILEDYGFLPRIAFNMDKLFNKCGSCGKQSLTMCMGFGCNAVGVTGCRIIDSKREQLISIITNNFIPCNGRFPTIIALITIFFANNNSVLSALVLTIIILVSVFTSLIISKILSKTILKGTPSSFTLELPPYRKPQFFKTIIQSISDKTVKILLRAITVAAPTGLIIWILSNTYINQINTLTHISNFLNPFANMIGLDGAIVLAFTLGFPANEIVIPIMLMCYLNKNQMMDYKNLYDLKTILINNGWTVKTALCTIIFFIMHFPCSTTCLTIRKETNSFKWMLISMLIPTICGITLCFLINLI